MGWHPFDTYMVVSILKLSYDLDDLGAPHFKIQEGSPPEFGTKAIIIAFFVLHVLTMVFLGISLFTMLRHGETDRMKNVMAKKKWCVATKSRVAPVKRPVHLSSSGPSIWRITSSTDCLIYYTTIYYYMIIWFYMQFWYFRFSEARNPAVKLTSSHQSALAWKSCPGGRLVAILMSCGCPTCTDSGGRH